MDMENVCAIVENFFGNCTFPIYQGRRYAVKLIPYQVFDYPEGHAVIDAYYFISNAVYHECKNTVRRLKEVGIFTEPANLNLKKMLAFCEIAYYGKNTLTYTEAYGSRFYIAAIDLGAESACRETRNALKRLSACEGCTKCMKACPTGAITEGGFLRERCLREQMENRNYSDAGRKLAGRRMLGCDICQRACPLNSKERVCPSREILDHTEFIPLLEDIRKGELDFYKQNIGKNYAGRRRLAYTALNAAINGGNEEVKRYLNALEIRTESDRLDVAVNKLCKD